jgi:hypothetical protein
MNIKSFSFYLMLIPLSLFCAQPSQNEPDSERFEKIIAEIIRTYKFPMDHWDTLTPAQKSLQYKESRLAYAQRGI